MMDFINALIRGLWGILFLIFLGLFFITVIYLSIRRYLKNIYLKGYVKDDLYKYDMAGGTKNFYYYTLVETRPYIPRYVIRKSLYRKQLILNYEEPFNSISFFIIEYNKRHKPIGVKKVRELSTKTTSRIMELNNRVDSINIYVNEVNGFELNARVIRQIPKANRRLYSIISSLSLFSFLFCLRHILACIFAGKERIFGFSNNLLNYIIIGVCLVVTILYLFMTLIGLAKRNIRTKNGGSMEYEFF